MVYLAIDDGRQRQVVEDLGAVSPHGDRAVLAEALVIEAVDLGDLPGLVVSPDQRYPVWVAHLRGGAHRPVRNQAFDSVREVQPEHCIP